MKIVHMVAFAWRDAASPEQRQSALAEFETMAADSQGLFSVVVVANRAKTSLAQGFDDLAVFHFSEWSDLETFRTYKPHVDWGERYVKDPETAIVARMFPADWEE